MFFIGFCFKKILLNIIRSEAGQMPQCLFIMGVYILVASICWVP